MARIRRVFTVAAAFLVAAAAATGSGTATSSAPARVVDRTFSCAVARYEGARMLDVVAVSGYRDPDQPAEWEWQPAAWALDRVGSSLASVTAGAPPLQVRRQRIPMLAVVPAKCRPSEGIPFSRRGLVGGPASQLQGSDRYECRAGSRVLVRVRAVFRAPTTFTTQRYRGRVILATPPDAVVREGRLAIRTLEGKPLVDADVHESGRARLFTAASCLAD
jgi:hypothetical protein